MRLYEPKGFTESEEIMELLSPYLFRMRPIGMFHGMPVGMSRKLLGILPEEHGKDRQNDSPTFAEFVSLAEQFDGTLDGYVIWSNRDDERITVDTLIVPREKGAVVAAWFVTHNYEPDEDEERGDFRRFWWD